MDLPEPLCHRVNFEDQSSVEVGRDQGLALSGLLKAPVSAIAAAHSSYLVLLSCHFEVRC